ncbi:MAG: zf-HC2 domain-containing protein [Labilithrix sp.]|nr:zf-HC2 domain-containing protein [Labilithrix sp.]
MSCTGTPISWLRLERLHAGEVDDAERAEIEAHLASCAACKACLAKIEGDDAVALPPLAKPAKVHVLRRAAPAIAALAVAAGVLLLVRRPPEEDPAAGGARAKGSDVSFALVRDDEQAVDGSAGTYRDGDRFKAIVTCPPGMNATWDLVVYERGEAGFPLAVQRDLSCGNAVPMRGAFRTTGREPLTVCLTWNVDRDSLRRAPPEASASCKVLAPAP